MHVKLFVYHPTLLCYSMLLGNNYSTLIHSFDRGFIIYIYTLPFHTLETCYSTIRSLLKGLISLYFTKLSSIIFHCPINPCFWEGTDVACQTFLLSSCIAQFQEKLLYPHSLCWEEIDSSIKICIYINMSFKNIFYHPSCLSHSIL